MISAVLPAMISAATMAQTLPVVETVPCAVRDRQDAQSPDANHLDGFLGGRIDANAYNRLLQIDEARLLEGFRHRPGRQSWDGEHVGKWLHAATLAWVYTQNPQLRAKLDRVVSELGKCQLDDGYLGTYLPAQRWTEWDVWAHKYDMIGLLTYYRFTGNQSALDISRRCADLLCRTFGTGPNQRNILAAGHHRGMAPTSVLEPMVWLYRFTGDRKYLDFCRYILEMWETPQGPKIISTLLTSRRVDRVGNAKAYEMLSCLNGLLELYRTTGEERMLQAALNAWQDIVDKRLYVTGTASYRECFHDDYDLPNGNASVAETCVTVTWIQLNAQLLRLTGQARFAGQLERSVCNQLFGAQKPDGTAWGYYVQLEGRKPYSADLSGHCCLSSGPRAVALIPTFSTTTDADGVVINFLGQGRSRLTLRNGHSVGLEVSSRYPADGQVRVTLKMSSRESYSVRLRVPAWCPAAAVSVNGKDVDVPVCPGEYATLRRRWRDGDVIALDLSLNRAGPDGRPARTHGSVSLPHSSPQTAPETGSSTLLQPSLIVGDHGNRGKVAFGYGPLILAADDALNPGAPIGAFEIQSTDLSQVVFEVAPAPQDRRSWEGAEVYSVPAVLTTNVLNGKAGEAITLRLVPFADAGSTLAPYQVWLPVHQTGTAPTPGTRF